MIRLDLHEIRISLPALRTGNHVLLQFRQLRTGSLTDAGDCAYLLVVLML
jgi:hypothetical protein